MTTFLLVDNGSVRPEATLQLRTIAKTLTAATHQLIYPVSLQHANTISAEKLDGIKASTFQPFLQEKLHQGEREFIVLPLFFGLSRALTGFIPDTQAVLQKEIGNFNVSVADVLYPLPQGDSRLATILYQHIQQTAEKENLPITNIALVDHGSPLKQVTLVRNAVTAEVQTMLGGLGGSCTLEQAAMERRAGKQYDFNGKLLEEWLVEKAEQGETSAIISLLFSLPGRHAGKKGDIETICQSVTARYPQFKAGISPLVGEHPLLIEILQERMAGFL